MVEQTKTEDATSSSSVEHTEAYLYELGYHLLPTISEEELPARVDALKKLITKHNGKITAEGVPLSIPLSYTMVKVINSKHEKFDHSNFGWIAFEAPQSSIAHLQEELFAVTDILRFLLIHTEKETAEEKRPPILRVKKGGTPKVITMLRKEEEQVPVSEEELEKSIEELMK